MQYFANYSFLYVCLQIYMCTTCMKVPADASKWHSISLELEWWAVLSLPVGSEESLGMTMSRTNASNPWWGKVSSAPLISNREMTKPFLVQIWMPIVCKSSSCCFLPWENLRGLTYRDLLLTLANPVPVLYIENSLRFWPCYCQSIRVYTTYLTLDF